MSSHVLVAVEDDPDFQVLIRAALSADESLEMASEVPTNVDRAIELARETSPQVIILDHDLEGEKSGLEAAPKLKEVAPEAKILLFTAFDMAAEARREPAVDAYLRKDAIDRLLTTVRRLLDL